MVGRYLTFAQINNEGNGGGKYFGWNPTRQPLPQVFLFYYRLGQNYIIDGYGISANTRGW